MIDIGVQYSPISLYKAMRLAINRNRGAKIDEAEMIDYIAKGSIGCMLMGLGAALPMMIGGNKDKNMQDVDRAMNIPYDTINIGDADISIQKLSSAAVPMIAGWYAKQLIASMTADQKELDEIYGGSRVTKAADATFRTSKAMVGAFGGEGALSAFNTLNGEPNTAWRFAGAMATPYIPFSGTSKMLNSMVDFDARKAEGFGDTVKQSVPFGSFFTPKRVSSLGDVQQRPNPITSPFGITMRNSDPVYKELYRLRAPLGKDSKEVYIGNGAKLNMSLFEMNDANLSPEIKRAKNTLLAQVTDPNSDYNRLQTDDQKRMFWKNAFEIIGNMKQAIKTRTVSQRPTFKEDVTKSMQDNMRKMQSGR